MPTLPADIIANALNLRINPARAGGMSGAGVYPATRTDGTACVLKIADRADPRAERECAVYETLSLPVRTPDVLDTWTDEATIALVLSDGGEVLPAADWSAADWRAVAHDLASLHTYRPPQEQNWRKRTPTLTSLQQPELAAIASVWRPVIGEGLDQVLANRDRLQADIAASGEGFVHGDCHAGNIIPAAGGPVWIDWQEAHIGHPAWDLAFLRSRAIPAGATMPTTVLDTYCAARGIDRDVFARAVLAAELAITIFDWPTYMEYLSAEERSRLKTRARKLVSAWLINDPLLK